MSDGILNSIDGEDNIRNFQYYISTPITLYFEESISRNFIQESGTARATASVTNTIIRRTITIDDSTPCVVLDHYWDDEGERWILEVAVDEGDDAILLFLRNPEAGSDGKYYLFIDDPAKGLIEYGDKIYSVSYAGSEVPYLLVRMRTRLIEDDRRIQARGRTLPR